MSDTDSNHIYLSSFGGLLLTVAVVHWYSGNLTVVNVRIMLNFSVHFSWLFVYTVYISFFPFLSSPKVIKYSQQRYILAGRSKVQESIFERKKRERRNCHDPNRDTSHRKL